MQFFSESPAPWKRQQESVKSAIKISTSEITTAEVVDLPTPLAPPTITEGLEMQRLWCIFQMGKGSSSPLIGDHELESGGMGVRVSASVRWGGIIRDSIAGMWERFSLTEKEGQKIKISGEVEATEFLLAGHFLTRRPINVEAVMRTFLPVWKLDKAFRVRDMRVNKVVFIFTDEVLDEEEAKGGGNCVWVRVLMDICKPSCRGRVEKEITEVLALYRDKITAVDCNLKMISVAMLKAVPYCYDSGFRDVLMECTNQKLISLIQHVDGYSIEIGEQLDDLHCVSVLFQGVRGPHCPCHDQFLMCTLSSIGTVCFRLTLHALISWPMLSSFTSQAMVFLGISLDIAILSFSRRQPISCP
uniref:DUF4283 domain-containing protein n=1 Tax=Fagus sylvatica TaxID=28930 RepID=A0A2N9GS14_FAGSY